ncbi:thiol:disulfide interchange protein TlpA [Pseudorhodoplanes sp.]|jgi:thiol-disulfide isomerase/thioredoxin|uniref:thiol:disulfide interchange protein TlpA n=1 Tax=Pseudorhodoplanes sp. TaxID=1934341 RepID=UPI002C3A15EE|nr:TlpA disulfide reductase family protein [Pseudorhodoplanes sp.]HWV42906.1 TlpA disulfide reductase family protein [Pseudorhodoplanes sp.]
MPSNDASDFAKKRLLVMLIGALAGVAVALIGIYGMGWLVRKSAVPEGCGPAVKLAEKLQPLARGEVAALAPAKSPIRLTAVAFRDSEGKERTIADWKGKTVLLNLWATWCAPCKKEMPALDELQQKLGGADFEVVAVNIDTRNPEKAKAWLSDTGIKSLGYYADNSARIFQDLKEKGRAFGMPTTILVDANGCEVATLAGPAEWASDDALKFIQTALGR